MLCDFSLKGKRGIRVKFPFCFHQILLQISVYYVEKKE